MGSGLPGEDLSGFAPSPFGEKDYREAVELLTESFCSHDPIEIALSITPDEFRTMISLELEAVQRNGLSLVVREPGGRMVAAAIAMDALAPPVDSCGPASPKFAPIAEIARRFHDSYFSTRTVAAGSTVYLFAIGVLPGCLGRGLGRLICRASLRNAREKGYRSAFALTTNTASGRMLLSSGFDVIDRVLYQDYRYDNRAVFASVTDHPSIDLMECRDLGKVPGV